MQAAPAAAVRVKAPHSGGAGRLGRPAPAAAAAAAPRRTMAPAAGGAALATGAATDDEKARAVAIFRQTWDVYTKVVEKDYMSHVLLFDSLSKDMEARAGGGGGGQFSLVDLGCGGADALAAMLRRNPRLARRVGSYTGVDLSDIALAHARANMLGGPVEGGFPDVRASAPADGALPPLPPSGGDGGGDGDGNGGGGGGGGGSSPRATFVEADMVSFAESLPAGSADVILAAFALHHLTPELKRAVVAAAARALKPRTGIFYYLDVWRLPGEERDAYLRRYRALLDGWEALTPRESAFIWDHVSAFDFPADEREVAATPYFAGAEVLARDGGPHALVRLSGPRPEGAAGGGGDGAR